MPLTWQAFRRDPCLYNTCICVCVYLSVHLLPLLGVGGMRLGETGGGIRHRGIIRRWIRDGFREHRGAFGEGAGVRKGSGDGKACEKIAKEAERAKAG